MQYSRFYSYFSYSCHSAVDLSYTIKVEISGVGQWHASIEIIHLYSFSIRLTTFYSLV